MKVILLLASLAFHLYASAQIFVYHRFGDDRYPSTNTTIKQLKYQFDYLKEHNYKVVPLQNIVDKIYKKEKIPDNWVALTIDDSFKSFLQNGLKVFKQYNYPFTMFVYIKAAQDNYNDFLNWDELREVAKHGDLQLHSFGHLHMTKENINSVLKDTEESYKLFVKELGSNPTMYAYPYGEYNEEVKNALTSFNFKAIFNQNNGSVTHNSNPLDINRIALVGDVNMKEKLKYETLDVNWIEPKSYPKNGILKKVKAKVDPSIKNAKLYVSGDKWRDIKVNNGIIDANLNIKLKNGRSRVIIGTDFYTISNKLLIKHK